MSIGDYHYNNPDVINYLSEIPGFDPSFTLVYYNAWGDFDSSAWCAIFERDGEYFKCSNGYDPAAYNEPDHMKYDPISLKEALEEIEDMENICNQMSIKMSR